MPLRRLLCSLFLLGVTAAAQAQHLPLDSGIYWSPSFPGMAVAVESHDDQAFAVVLEFDPQGRPTWYTLQSNLVTDSAHGWLLLSGTLLEHYGGPCLFCNRGFQFLEPPRPRESVVFTATGVNSLLVPGFDFEKLALATRGFDSFTRIADHSGRWLFTSVDDASFHRVVTLTIDEDQSGLPGTVRYRNSTSDFFMECIVVREPRCGIVLESRRNLPFTTFQQEDMNSSRMESQEIIGIRLRREG